MTFDNLQRAKKIEARIAELVEMKKTVAEGTVLMIGSGRSPDRPTSTFYGHCYAPQSVGNVQIFFPNYKADPEEKNQCPAAAANALDVAKTILLRGIDQEIAALEAEVEAL